MIFDIPTKKGVALRNLWKADVIPIRHVVDEIRVRLKSAQEVFVRKLQGRKHQG